MTLLSVAGFLAVVLLPFALIRLAVPRRRAKPRREAFSATLPVVPFRQEPTIHEAPSPVSFQGRSLRVIAYLFDGTVVWFALFAFVPGGLPHFDTSGNAEFVLLLWWIGVAFCHAFWGRTPGKLLCGLKVVRYSNDSPPRLRAALLRESREFVLPTLAMMLFALGSDTANPVYQAVVIVFLLFAAADFVWFLFDRQAQSLHDRIAGTRVVRTPLVFV